MWARFFTIHRFYLSHAGVSVSAHMWVSCWQDVLCRFLLPFFNQTTFHCRGSDPVETKRDLLLGWIDKWSRSLWSHRPWCSAACAFSSHDFSSRMKCYFFVLLFCSAMRTLLRHKLFSSSVMVLFLGYIGQRNGMINQAVVIFANGEVCTPPSSGVVMCKYNWLWYWNWIIAQSRHLFIYAHVTTSTQHMFRIYISVKQHSTLHFPFLSILFAFGGIIAHMTKRWWYYISVSFTEFAEETNCSSYNHAWQCACIIVSLWLFRLWWCHIVRLNSAPSCWQMLTT